MADVYRAYLDKTEGKSTNEKYSTIDINMVGGTMIKKSFVGVPYETLYASTTLKDVSDIVKDIKKAGVKISNLSLLGFGENGLDSYKLAGNF